MVEYESLVGRLSRDELEDVQFRRLGQVIDQALTSNPFYSRKLRQAGLSDFRELGSLEDCRRLPFTTKGELSADQLANPPFGTNLTFPVERYLRVHQTSGTKGKPLRWLDTQESWRWWGRCWETVYRGAGVRPCDRVFLAFSFGPFVGFWSAHQGALQLGALAVPGGGMTSIQRIRTILDYQVTVLACTPTYALHLAEVASQEGIDLSRSDVRVTIHAGEPGAGLPATRARIEQAWGARCFDHAGATEVGAWGFEVEGCEGMLLNEGEFIFEVIDPVSEAPAQEGELVVSNLGREGMPVIRYRTGDRVRLLPAADASPRFRRLDGGIIGRIDDVLVVRGINVFPSAIENVVRRIPEIGEFAADVYRKGQLDELELRIEASPSSDPAEAARKLIAEMRNSLSLRISVNPVPFGSLPRFDLKARRFKDHRRQD